MVSHGRPSRGAIAALALGVIAGAAPAFAQDAGDLSRQARCVALVAYAEAAGEGRAGVEAVVRVIANRMAHPDFPKDACAVVAQSGQFQPVGERSSLRAALTDPSISGERALGGTVDLVRLAEAEMLATMALAGPSASDPTSGALWFVNPRLMDPGLCGWFAGLRLTTVIGAHVFMTERDPGESRGSPALDCKALDRMPAVAPPGDDALLAFKGGARRTRDLKHFQWGAPGDPSLARLDALLRKIRERPAGAERPSADPPSDVASAEERRRVPVSSLTPLSDLTQRKGGSRPSARVIGTRQAAQLARKLEQFRFWYGTDGRPRVVELPEARSPR